VWVIGRHRLICGDCRDAATVARLLDGARGERGDHFAALCLAANLRSLKRLPPIPPDEYVAWFGEVARNIESVLAPDGSYFLNIKEHSEEGERSLYVKDLVLAHRGSGAGASSMSSAGGIPRTACRANGPTA
jgi:hypothetical protein